MKCSFCGNELREGAIFCGYCGHRVGVESKHTQIQVLINDHNDQQPAVIEIPSYATKDDVFGLATADEGVRRLLAGKEIIAWTYQPGEYIHFMVEDVQKPLEDVQKPFDEDAQKKPVKNYVGKSVGANYFRGAEGVGGKLYFDETGITFKSHMFNIQTRDERIEYNEMIRFAKFNPLGAPTGMSIITKEKEHRFVVYNREKIIAFLQSRLKAR